MAQVPFLSPSLSFSLSFSLSLSLTHTHTQRNLPHVEVATGQERCVRDVLHAEKIVLTGVTG